MEVLTPAGTRADCVSDTHAIEVEAAQDWAEAIGQALHYAEQTRLRAKIILFCERPSTCVKHRLILDQTIAANRLAIDVEMASEACHG